MEEYIVIEQMQKMCEESCSPSQFEEWEKLKTHLIATRKNLRAAQQSVHSDACPECGGKKKLLNSVGYPVNCHVCNGTGKRR